MTKTNNAIAIEKHIRKETIMNFIINLVLNAGIAYALLGKQAVLNPWGEHGYVMDLLITGFLLSTILGGIFIVMSRRKRDSGDLKPAGHEGQSLSWLLPYNPWLAAPVLGILGAVVAVPLLLGFFFLLEVTSLSPIEYAAIKGIWAALLASVMVPIAILQGLRANN